MPLYLEKGKIEDGKFVSGGGEMSGTKLIFELIIYVWVTHGKGRVLGLKIQNQRSLMSYEK